MSLEKCNCSEQAAFPLEGLKLHYETVLIVPLEG